MNKLYPCRLADNKKCKYGGNKYYNHGKGYEQGSAEYCRFAKKWVSDLKICPLINLTKQEG